MYKILCSVANWSISFHNYTYYNTCFLGYILSYYRNTGLAYRRMRSGRADELDIEIANLNKQVAGSAKTTAEKLKLNLQSLKKDRTVYRAGSRFIAQWLGLGIGVLVALVGVRVLGNIVDITTLSKAQEAAFVVVDVLLTGAVLAGGSEAINKIMKVYNSFMIKTAEKAKG